MKRNLFIILLSPCEEFEVVWPSWGPYKIEYINFWRAFSTYWGFGRVLKTSRKTNTHVKLLTKKTEIMLKWKSYWSDEEKNNVVTKRRRITVACVWCFIFHIQLEYWICFGKAYVGNKLLSISKFFKNLYTFFIKDSWHDFGKW